MRETSQQDHNGAKRCGTTPFSLAGFSVCFLGLSTIRIWTQCSLYGFYHHTDAGDLTIAGNIARTLLIAALLAIALRRPFSALQERSLSWFSVTAMTVSAILLLIQSEHPDLSLAMPATIIGGLGVCWGGGMWMKFYARLEPEESLVYAFTSLALSSLLAYGIGLMPSSAIYLTVIFMPTLSIVTYWQSMKKLDERDQDALATGNAYDSEPPSTFVRLLAGIALLNFALGVARGFPFGDSIPLGPYLQAAVPVLVTLYCAVVLTWSLVIRRKITFGGIWQTQVIMMTAGVILVATLSPTAMSWGAAVLTLSNTIMLALLWYCSYDFARHSPLASYAVVGIVWIAHLLPREIGRWAIAHLGALSHGSVLIIAAAICLLALSMAFVLSDSIPRKRPFFAELNERAARIPASSDPLCGRSGASLTEGARENGSDEPEGDAQQDDGNRETTLDERCALLQAAFSLTDRETDMVRMIAQGNSKQAIGEKLFLSENTVKSYTRNVYRKTGVHTKQSLIDMLYELPPRKES